MARILLLGFATSMVLHGMAYASLELAPATAPPRTRASTVVFETVETPRVAAEPTPPKPLEPEPKVVSRPERAPAPAPPPESPAEAPRAPVDLSGVTLTNVDGAASFAMPGGDGSSRSGPVGPLRTLPSQVPVASSSAAPQPAPPAPEIVPSSDLSERPRPPLLDSLLRSLYPDEARRRGISGSASLRVRIDPDGRVGAASLMVESFPGFGAACRKAVLGSRWSPPRDRDGHNVRTEVRYTCRFVVD